MLSLKFNADKMITIHKRGRKVEVNQEARVLSNKKNKKEVNKNKVSK